ncbi:MAG: type II toxin-antitoxin system RelE/ParE family toxin [Rhodospirillaceae bacterium]|nr:type II toxin-antitoxin system RelE/ParE family toxin [Rhodospirillaceae bacterium]
MRRLVFRPEAERDLYELHTFIAQDNLAAADQFAERVERRCREIQTMPFAGRPRDRLKKGLRSVTFRNYIILYRVRNDAVVILRVIHGRRRIEDQV